MSEIRFVRLLHESALNRVVYIFESICSITKVEVVGYPVAFFQC